MSGDYSAERFNPRLHLSGLLQQQGRVHYDGDANQLMRILGRRARAQTADAVGRVAVPRETLDGFKIRVAGGKLTIGRGRIYVDGLLAENHGSGTEEFDRLLEESRGASGIAYDKQPYLPNGAEAPAVPSDGGPHLVYLVVYEREATHLELPDLVDRAIGQDTVAALQTVWQVRVLDNVEARTNCETPDAGIRKWNDLLQPSAGRLTTSAIAVEEDPNPCVLPARGGYRGLYNQNYRIEVHEPGALGTAKIKWSRDNATVATNVTKIDGAVLSVGSTGRDEVLRFNPNDTVEITDDSREFTGKAGEIRRVKSVSDALQTIELDAALPADLVAGLAAPGGRHTRIRRWDSDGLITVPAGGEPVVLERGVQATFTLVPGGGGFQTFDYWTFVARTADAWVEPLKETPPRGIHRHYARLAVVEFPNTVFDCRTIWPPLPTTSPDDGSAPGIRVSEVIDSTGSRLLNDASVEVRAIARGIRIRTEGSIDPESIERKPTCVVTIELPFPLNRADTDIWGQALLGYSPIILNARLTVEERDIIWTPERDTAEWLVGRLFQTMRDMRRPVDEVMAHLTLKGNFIWGRERREDRLVYLDGDTFGRPRDSRTDVIFATGEGTRGGDLRMWFRLIPDRG